MGKHLSKILCIYHGNCADGFTSAWVVREALGNDVEFHAGFFKDPLPDVKGKTVYVVDFSYSRDIMEQMVDDAERVIHIDHHLSAIKDMEGYSHHKFSKWYSPENKESGAMLAWSYFFEDAPVPQFIKHIDDRDRWQFLLPGTREINANAFSYEYTFENWDMLMRQELDVQIKDGSAIQRKAVKDIKELSNVVVRRANIAGYNVPLANVPYQFGVEMCSFLAKGEPFAAYYYDRPTHREFGLRSELGMVDVSVIAKSFGGGGHANMSGFRLSFEEARKFEIND
jgi:oligoribonuclease NrnB/cAMP/cGMP phosphodiesterase (DHH superfamily)